MRRSALWFASVFHPRKDGGLKHVLATLLKHEHTETAFQFGESVMWRSPDGRPDGLKCENRYGLGAWVGTAGGGERIRSTPRGAARTRARR